MQASATALIIWDDTFSVGVSEVDEQHRNLFRLINELHTRTSQYQNRDSLRKTLNELFTYAAIHFATEEFYFDKFGYPEGANHKREHAEFIAELTSLKNNFDSGKTGLLIGIMNFLRDWLSTHIEGSDLQYGPFFNSKSKGLL